MRAYIYAPAKTAMQSGKGKTHQWILKYENKSARKVEPLMGYTSSNDTNTQMRLTFSSLEAAENFCRKKGLDYQVRQPHQPRRHKIAYANNFS